MHKSLFSVVAVALFAATVIGANQPDRTASADQPDRTKAGATADKAASVDGEWTVVSVSRDGSAVDGADKMTVTIKGNVVTFASMAGGDNDKSKMRALRLDFGPQGTLRVAEAGADGKFGTGGPGSTGTTPGGTGSTPGGRDTPAAGTGTQPGGTSTQPGSLRAGGSLSGVYVMTPDFLAVSVFTPGTGTGGSGRPGGTGTAPGGRNDTPPPGGTGTQPGGAGTQPGGSGAGATTAGPQMKTHLSVILKRSGSGGSRP